MWVLEPQPSGPRSSQGSQSSRIDDLLFLSLPWTYEAGLPLEARILRFQNNVVPDISGACTNTVHSSIPQCGPEEPISILRCCTSIFCYTDGPEYGLRSRTGLTIRDFKDPEACLCHYTTGCQWISQSYRVRFCYLAYGQGYYLIMVHRIHSSLHQS